MANENGTAVQDFEDSTRKTVALRIRLKELRKTEKETAEYLSSIRQEIKDIEDELGI